MRGLNVINLLTTLILIISVNEIKAETCTTNALGDRTCTTSTAGTTTGNVLTNSTFGTSDYNTNGWTISGDVGHGHNNTSGTTQSGQNTSGGVLAFEGDPNGSIYQDVDLVGDGKLTQAQINEGFTSTMSSDIWFWNNTENTFTLKQTITAGDGTVTTQTRNINDHDPNRAGNAGQWNNYTDSYTHNTNTQTDFTIRAEVYNNTAGTASDGAHRGPDVDNVQLSITTAGVQSTTITLCTELGTCTDAGNDIANAVDLTTDDGVDLFQDLDTKVDDAVKNFEQIEVVSIDTTMLIEDDLGKIEEVKFEEFVQTQFTDFIETNDLVQEFNTALVEENITEEQFFEEVGNMMKEELNVAPEPKVEEPKMEENNVVATKSNLEEETIKEEPKQSGEPKIENEPKQEESNASNTNSNEPEPNNTETTKEDETSSTSEPEASESTEEKSTESSVDEDTKAEGETTETANEESVDADETGTTKETDVDSGNEKNIASSISAKVEKIIKKLENTLMTVDQKVKAVQFITLKAMSDNAPDMSSYKNQSFYSSVQLPDGNVDFFNQLNIEQTQIYKSVTLAKYTDNDPLTTQRIELDRIKTEENRLKIELEQLRKQL